MTDDPHIPVALTSVPSDIVATMIVAALSNEGIEAVATGGFTAGFLAEAPGSVRVMVKREDLSRAQQVLDQFEKSQTPIDWSKVDVGQPDDGEP